MVTTATYDLDYRLTGLNVKDGTTLVQGKTFAYGDGINLTGIMDTVTAANSNTLSYSPANRLASASGAWGSAAYSYDPMGNRLSDVVTGPVNTNRVSTMNSFSIGVPAIRKSHHISNQYIAVTHSSITLAPAIGRFVADKTLNEQRNLLLEPFHSNRLM